MVVEAGLMLSVVESGVEEMRSSRSLRFWVASASRRASSAATRDCMCSSRSLARVLSVSGLAWRALTRSWEKRTGVSLGLISVTYNFRRSLYFPTLRKRVGYSKGLVSKSLSPCCWKTGNAARYAKEGAEVHDNTSEDKSS